MTDIPEWAKEAAQAFADKWIAIHGEQIMTALALALMAAEERGKMAEREAHPRMMLTNDGQILQESGTSWGCGPAIRKRDGNE